jgi:hypothetical protein
VQAVFNQRYAFGGMVVVLAAFLVAVLWMRSCVSGLRVEGDAKNRVEVVEQIPYTEARAIPALVEHLGDPASPKASAFFGLDCSQIVRDDIAHLVYADSTDCPSLTLPDIMGFDVIANYWDAACSRPPKLKAQHIDGKIAFTVDTTGSRGSCDDMSIPSTLGITLKR